MTPINLAKEQESYPTVKPIGFILIVWEIIEDVQNAHPYYHFGWDGFNMIIWE